MARGRRAEEEMEDLSCDTSKRTNTELQSPVCEVTTVLYCTVVTVVRSFTALFLLLQYSGTVMTGHRFLSYR